MIDPTHHPQRICPQRICFVAPFGLRVKGTVRARTLPLARVLAKRGYEVMVLIPPWDSPEDAGKSWDDAGVRIVNISVTGGLPLILARIVGEIRRFRPQILHIVKPRAHAGMVQWLMWQSRRWTKFPRFRIVLDVDDWEQAWADVVVYSRPVARFLAWQEEWGIRHADGITAASRWLESRASGYAPTAPICYLPNGVPVPDAPNPPQRTITARKPVVLLFSRFVEVSPSWMEEFWGVLQKRVPGVGLKVVGEAIIPGLDDKMRIVIDRATGGESQVAWLGYVDGAALAEVMNGADCAIFPAEDVPLNQAKCSVRLATTLMAGLPVVASAVGEQANYGGDGAAKLLAADASPVAFAQAVADLLAAPQDRAALAALAQERMAALYDWNRLGAELDAFYA